MKFIIRTLLVALPGTGFAQAGGICKQSTEMAYDTACKKVHATLIHQQGVTGVLFAKDSEVEQAVIKAIDNALR